MKVRALFITSAALGSLALSALAQDGGTYSYHTPAKPQSADEVEDLGDISAADNGQESSGKVETSAVTKPKFRFNVSTRAEFTSNAKLTGDHSSGDFFGLPSVEAGYNIALGKYFTFDLEGKVESVIYAQHNDRGFIGYSANATLDFRPVAGAPRVYISAEPYRYDSFDIGNSITQAIGLAAGTDWGYAFNNGRSLIYGGYNYEHYFADPDIDDRNSHRVVVGLAQQLRSNVTAQLFYAWQYNEFVEVSRHDSRHLVGVNLIYNFSDNWLGTLGGSYVDNDSDAMHASYQSLNASVGLTLQF